MYTARYCKLAKEIENKQLQSNKFADLLQAENAIAGLLQKCNLVWVLW